MRHPLGNSGSGPARRMLGAAAVVGALTMTAHGSVWSVVNLHPAGATESRAYGVQGGQQVGEAYVGGVGRASLWTGSAASWVDLHPAGAIHSVARGVHGGQQVGDVSYISSIPSELASLWTGTAASLVDLNPGGYSWAYGVYGGQQVGYTTAAEVNARHASLWTGSAASWVDLHPAGGSGSVSIQKTNKLF